VPPYSSRLLMPSQTGHSTAHLCVLVVEDDLAFGEIIENLLLENGYEVRLAQTVSQALRLFNETAFSAALLDVKLGDELVFGVADLLQGQHVPYMFMSGPYIDAVPASHAGVLFVRKPFRLRDLLRQVAAMTGREH